VNILKKNKKYIITTLSIALIFSILFVMLFLGVSENRKANAVTNFKNTIQIGDLTLSNYESRTDGKVFDGNQLQKLYDTLLGTSGATLQDVKDALNDSSTGMLNSAYFRTKNSSKVDVVVTLGGMRWIATLLSVNNSTDNQVLLTLWLANSNEIPADKSTYRTSQWTTHATNSKGTYPANLYSKSKLRIQGLNIGGQYATSPTALGSVVEQNKDHAFAKFTMPNSTVAGKEVSGSFYDFIETPENVKWQELEQYKNYGGTVNYENDSYSSDIYGYQTGSEYRSSWLNDCVNYGDWKSDKIWIPSIAEMSYTSGGAGKGIWAPSTEMYNNSANYWIRSPSVSSGRWNYCHNQNGTGIDSNGTLAIRPAFHLNLELAEASSYYTITEPSSVTDIIYDGTDRDLTSQTWYKGYYNDSQVMQVEYLNEDGSQKVTPRNVGKYKAKFTLLNTTKYGWSNDNGSNERIVDFEIKPKEVDFTWGVNADGIAIITGYERGDLCGSDTLNFSVHYKSTDTGGTHDSTDLPKKVGHYRATALVDNINYAPLSSKKTTTFELLTRNIKLPTFTPSTWYTYNGVREYRYQILFDVADVKVSVPTRFADKITLSGDRIVVKQAGEYALAIELTDPDNSQWSGDGILTGDNKPREVTFCVNKAAMELEIAATDGKIDFDYGEDGSISVESIDSKIYVTDDFEDQLNLEIYAVGSTSGKTLLHSGIELIEDGIVYPDLKISEIFTPGVYDLLIELTGESKDNYTLIYNEVKLNVEIPSEDGKVIWRLMADGRYTNNSLRVEIGANSQPARYEKSKITYDGREYSFEVRETNEYKVDKTYSGAGFVNGYKDDRYTNAGKYSTQVAIILTGTGETQVYTIEWEISKVLYDLSNVKWQGEGKLPYEPSGVKEEIDETTLPKGLVVKGYGQGMTGYNVGDSGRESVEFDFDPSDPKYALNYMLPDKNNKDSYIFTPSGSDSDFKWEIDWEVIAHIINVRWAPQKVDDPKGSYIRQVLNDPTGKYANVVGYEYYETDMQGNIKDPNSPLTSISVIEKEVRYYKTKLIFKAGITAGNYEFDKSGDGLYSNVFQVGRKEDAVNVSVEEGKDKLTYNGKEQGISLSVQSSSGAFGLDKLKIEYFRDGEITAMTGLPKNVGKYLAKISIKEGVEGFYLDGANVEEGYAIIEFEITPMKIDEDNWTTKFNPPSLKVDKDQLNGIGYEYKDAEGNILKFSDLKGGNTYQVRAVIKDKTNYAFEDGSTETEWREFTIAEGETIYDPTDPDSPSNDPDGTGSGDVSGNVGDKDGNGGGALDELLEKLKEIPLWQVIVSAVSILLIIIFMSLTASNESKRKRARKKEDKYSTVFAATAGFLGMAEGGWTAVACSLAGVAVISLIITIISARRRRTAEDDLEDAKEAYEKTQKNEDMKMMFMRMMGSNGNMGGQGTYMGQGMGADDIRGIVNETVTAMLPGMQQLLPQQASENDEIVQRLLEDNAKNQETIKELMQQLAEKPAEKIIEKEIAASVANDETIKALIEGQKAIMQKLAESPTERVVEKDTVANSVNDELVSKLIEQNQKLMEKLAEQPAQQAIVQPQIIEKIVEKPVEKIVEVPVETVVEKVVEKPIVISAEAEKSKQVKKTPSPKKAPAPRLTLEEAYAKLTKEQKKYFDGLREYAMSKDSKCKEKLSTYFTTIGPSTTNSFIKLTIKKGITVALFKMEDEYLKDIRRNASGDGTKVKVKETEIAVPDKQSYDTAKDMVDLRIDQIDRYNDFLKEQRAMKRK
jgi:hypothetical protein